GNIDIADAVRTLTWLFAGAEEPGCRAAANTNGDGNVDIADPIHLLAYLFAGGPAPEPPRSECGPPSLPTDVSIGCRTARESCGALPRGGAGGDRGRCRGRDGRRVRATWRRSRSGNGAFDARALDPLRRAGLGAEGAPSSPRDARDA